MSTAARRAAASVAIVVLGVPALVLMVALAGFLGGLAFRLVTGHAPPDL